MHVFVTLALEEVDVGLPYLLRVHILHHGTSGLRKFCKIATICHEIAIWSRDCIRGAQVSHEINNIQTKCEIPFARSPTLEIWQEKDNVNRSAGFYRQARDTEVPAAPADPRGFADKGARRGSREKGEREMKPEHMLALSSR